MLTTTSASWSSLAWRKRSALPFASSPWRMRWPSISLRVMSSQQRASLSSVHCSQRANSRWGGENCCSCLMWTDSKNLEGYFGFNFFFFFRSFNFIFSIMCVNIPSSLTASPHEPGHPWQLGQNPRQGFGWQELWGGCLWFLEERLCGILWEPLLFLLNTVTEFHLLISF